MILIDGKKAAAELREELKKEVLQLKSKYNTVPGLTVILIGELAPSKIYVKNKEKSAIEVGLKSEVIRYPETVDEKIVLNKTGIGVLIYLPIAQLLIDMVACFYFLGVIMFFMKEEGWI